MRPCYKGAFKACLLASAIVAAYTPAHAADADQSLRLEEIVITAERRETSLQDTPLAITAVSGELMAAMGVDDLQAFAKSTPGMQLSGISGSQQYISMRGNITEARGAAVAQSIGFFIDGLYFGRSNMFNQQLTDIERVEVLRGPQGTLWGHNIVGGSVNVITKDPTEELEADIKVTIGKFDRTEVSGRVAGPITDNLLGQLVYSSTKADGYVKNLDNGQELNDEDMQVLRGKLLWNVNDALTAKVSFSHARDRSGTAARNFFPGPGDATTGFVLPSDLETQTFARTNFGTDEIDTSALSLELSYELDNGMSLHSQTGYIDSETKTNSFAFFPFPQTFGDYYRDDDLSDETFSQEIRIASADEGRLFWQLGAYYYSNDALFKERDSLFGVPGTLAGNLFGTQFDTNGDGLVVTDSIEDADTESIALFGQGTYEVSDWVNLTAGFRYTEVDKDFTGTVSGESNPQFLQGPAFSQTVSESWDNFSPKVTADFHWDNVGVFDSLLAYVTYSEGWKEGGFDRGTSAADQLSEANAISPEEAENKEFGFKATFWDSRATFNIAVFETDYSGQQTVVPIPGATLVFNLDSSIEGYEIDGAVVLTEWLTVNYGYAYYDSAYADGASIRNGAGQEVSVAGNPTVNTPEDSFTLGWNAHWDLQEGMELAFRGNYSTQSEVESDPDAPLAAAASAGRPELLDLTEIKNLNASLSLSKDNWEVTLWGRNLTDEYNLNNAASFSSFWVNSAVPAGGPPNFANPGVKSFEGNRNEPRTYGVSVQWRL